MRRTGFLLGALAMWAVLLPACDGPIVSRSPESLYALAQEQIVNANYSTAVDTLSKIVREAPGSELAHRARALRVTLLAGMARGLKEIGEAYLAGYEKAADATYASRMRASAMDYFGRARGRSIAMVEAFAPLLREPVAEPLRVDLAVPVSPDNSTLAEVREGIWVEKPELLAAETTEVGRQLELFLAGLGGAGIDLEPAAFYLAVGQEIVSLSTIYLPEALGDRRMLRLFHERATSAASRAAELARQQGNRKLTEESERLRAHWRDVIDKM